ncbi:hypothetical protein SUGI_1115530 [Cryptomeria japonica]|nr:hypothetical protein SUGI_1115530 [Cryptomeria japonica]
MEFIKFLALSAEIYKDDWINFRAISGFEEELNFVINHEVLLEITITSCVKLGAQNSKEICEFALPLISFTYRDLTAWHLSEQGWRLTCSHRQKKFKI